MMLISAVRQVKQRQWAAFTLGCDPFQSTLLIHLQMLLPVSQNRWDKVVHVPANMPVIPTTSEQQ
jgi:hypothetical protein